MPPARFSKQQAQPAAVLDDEEAPCCPLCITELEEFERPFLPCPCGYQVCLFCLGRLQTEFNNQCPGCRTPYDSDIEAGLQRAHERAERERQEAAALAEATGARLPPKAAAQSKGSSQQQQQQQQRPDQKAEPDLHIEEEAAWPSLGCACIALPLGTGHSRRPLPRVSTARQDQESSCSTSSGTTTATTPQSPADSVVAYRAALPSPAQLEREAKAAALQGRCQVALQAGGLGAAPDPEGASLCVSLQEAIKLGQISVKQAAASLASYLRRKHQQAPLLGCCAGSPFLQQSATGSLATSPFAVSTGLLSLPPEQGELGCMGQERSVEHSLSCEALSLGCWVSSTSASGLPAVLSSSSLVPDGQCSSPTRKPGKLPLYARASTAAFPGFPSPLGPAADAADSRLSLGALKGRAPPPGFAALPRFQS